MPDPKTSDPAGSPRFPFTRTAKRQPPIWTREQFGPWICDVRVTPITGLRAAAPVFEVNCQWHKGPPLDTSLGPTPAGGMTASDVYVVDPAARDIMLTEGRAGELAVAIAQRAAELLQDGIKPDLPKIARDMRRRI